MHHNTLYLDIVALRLARAYRKMTSSFTSMLDGYPPHMSVVGTFTANNAILKRIVLTLNV